MQIGSKATATPAPREDAPPNKGDLVSGGWTGFSRKLRHAVNLAGDFVDATHGVVGSMFSTAPPSSGKRSKTQDDYASEPSAKRHHGSSFSKRNKSEEHDDYETEHDAKRRRPAA
jgi:hypothetical protein